MSRDGTHRSLHHDLRGARSAVQMNIQTLEALEAGETDVTPEKRLAPWSGVHWRRWRRRWRWRIG